MKKNPLQILTIIHWSMAVPMLVFGFAGYYFKVAAPDMSQETSLVFVGLPGVVLITAFPVSQMLFRKGISMINKNAELKTKISGYLSAQYYQDGDV